MDCRITLAQVNPALGNLAANLALHVERVEEARAAGSQVVVFPELSLTGYYLKDQTAEIALRLDSREVDALRALSKRISIAFGFVERSPEGRLYNAVAFLEDGEILHVHRKVHLVTYGMFEEEREFAAGERFEAFDSRHGRFGVLVCEDLWHASSAYQLFLEDVDVLLVPSSGPGRGIGGGARELDSVRVWRTLLEAQALLCQTWVCYVNRVGWEDGVCFAGGSRLLDPFGVEAAAVAGLDAGLAHGRMRSRELERARVATPLRRDAKPWILAEGLRRLGAGTRA